MIRILLSISACLFLCTCQSVPEPASKAYNISSFQGGPPRKTSSDCTFRYRLDNSFDKLDNQIQQQAVRAAFDLWQKAQPNITFIQRQDTQLTEMSIRFSAHEETTGSLQKSSFGLIRGDLLTLSTAKELNGVYTIFLDSDFIWDVQAITRVVAYHIGVFIGMPVSQENGSILNPSYHRETVKLSSQDIALVKALYPKPCSKSCTTFLPVQFTLSKLTTQSIRLDKQGTIAIKASGSMVVGYWLGWSTPAGLEKGLFSIPIGDYSINRAFNHAALLYKINNEKDWHLCGNGCEFQTDGISQCTELTLGINDIDLSDNTGAYNISVDYK